MTETTADENYADFAEGLRYLIAEAIIAELNDPRNLVELPGFRDGMQRARIIVDKVCRNQVITQRNAGAMTHRDKY